MATGSTYVDINLIMEEQMSKIIAYNVVKEATVVALSKSVDKLLDVGWEPHGSLSVITMMLDDAVYFQAMVKRE